MHTIGNDKDSSAEIRRFILERLGGRKWVPRATCQHDMLKVDRDRPLCNPCPICYSSMHSEWFAPATQFFWDECDAAQTSGSPVTRARSVARTRARLSAASCSTMTSRRRPVCRSGREWRRLWRREWRPSNRRRLLHRHRCRLLCRRGFYHRPSRHRLPQTTENTNEEQYYERYH